MAFTWKMSPVTVMTDISTSPADKILAYMYNSILANVSDSSYKWQVASYSATSPKYLLLSRKSGVAGRIIIFGQQGSTPAATAVYGNIASHLFIGYSPSSTENSPTTSWLTGPPLAASDFIRGTTFTGPTITTSTNTDWRFNYYDADAGLVFNISSNSNAGFIVNLAGELLLDATNTPISCVSGQGANQATNGWASSGTGNTTTTISKLTISTNTSYGATSPIFTARIGSNNYQLFKLNIFADANSATVLLDSSSGKLWFLPLPLVGATDSLNIGVAGRLRQMALGPNATREAVYTEASTNTILGYGLSYNASTPVNTLWLLNRDI